MRRKRKREREKKREEMRDIFYPQQQETL